MAAQTQNNTWPLPKFYFEVELGGTKAIFQEVSGLDIDTQIIEYRHGNSKEFSAIKMPGIKKAGNVTLKKGVFVKDNTFLDWSKRINMNIIERRTIVINLLDEGGKPTMTWALNNAWPTKITGTDMRPDGNEVAVETIELAHEGIKIECK
ncbi:phage tail protein [Pedobacter sp.]|uniref:phage tail protein n=1 Tax=Pedobacter sp. TaxID=1411316 RepID=UPI00396C4889